MPQKLPLLTQGSTTPWATLLASQFVSQLNLFSVRQTTVEVNYFRSFQLQQPSKPLGAGLSSNISVWSSVSHLQSTSQHPGACRPASQMPSLDLDIWAHLTSCFSHHQNKVPFSLKLCFSLPRTFLSLLFKDLKVPVHKTVFQVLKHP